MGIARSVFSQQCSILLQRCSGAHAFHQSALHRSKIASPTIEMGHKRKSRPPAMTSALPLEAVVEADFTNVGDVPTSAVSICSKIRGRTSIVTLRPKKL